MVFYEKMAVVVVVVVVVVAVVAIVAIVLLLLLLLLLLLVVFQCGCFLSVVVAAVSAVVGGAPVISFVWISAQKAIVTFWCGRPRNN